MADGPLDSEESSLAERIVEFAWTLGLAGVLAWPYRTIRRRAVQWGLGVALCAVTVLAASAVPQGIAG